MLPVDLSQSVVRLIEAFQKVNTSLTNADIILKVNEFVKPFEDFIPESDKNQIGTLLGRLSDQNSKAAACTELSNVVTSVAKAVQQPETMKAMAEQAKRLKEAESLLNRFYSDQTIVEKFVSLTTEQERLRILKKTISMETGYTSLYNRMSELVSLNIDRFKLTEPSRIALAQCLIEGDAIVCHLKKFKINDQKILKDLAIAIAKRNGPLVSLYIQDFNIKDENDRIEIAKIAAKQNATSGIAKYIPNYSISKEEDRFAIAMIEAPEESWTNLDGESWRKLDYYNIVTEPYRLALAEASLRYRPDHIANHIKKYKISKESDRLKLAESAAKSALEDNYEHFDDFELSEEGRTSVAKIAAATYGSREEGISKWISRFKLHDEKNRFEVAKIAADGTLWKSIDVTYYQLSEPHRIEIAMIRARALATSLLEDFKPYQITDEKKRVEIAKAAAEKDGEVFLYSWHTGSLNISNPIDREAILFTALENVPDNRLSSIEALAEKYDEADRVVLAKIMAKRSKYYRIDAFKISNETDRIAIAKVYVKHFGTNFAYYLNDYNIKDKKALLDLCFLVIPHEINVEDIEGIFGTFINKITEIARPESASWLKMEEEAMKTASGDLEVTIRLKNWLLNYGWACDMAQISEEVRKEQNLYASQILKYEDPALRYSLMAVLFQYGFPKKPEGEDQILLFDLVLTPLLKDSGLTDEEREQIWRTLKHKDYYDTTKKEKVLKGLVSLFQCEDLSAKDKGILLKHIFCKNSEPQQKQEVEKTPVHTALQMLDAILASNNVSFLKKEEQADKKEASEKDVKASVAEAKPLKQPIDLAAALNQIFTRSVGLEALSDFSQKYAKTIGAGRNPLALMIYAAKLGSLSTDEYSQVAKTLKEFATAVLEGTYEAWRYKTSENEHLEMIFKGREKLKKDWMAGESFSLGDFHKKLAEEDVKTAEAQPKTGATAYSTFDPVQFLKNKICDDKHIDPKAFPRLADCLQDPKKCAEALKKLAEENKKDKLSKGEKYNAANNKTKPIFLRQLEVALINLLVSSTPASKKASDIDKFVLPQLKTIFGDAAEITKDILLLQKSLQTGAQSETKANIEKKYLIEDTDKWEDMLLSGTEVAGSCQRISGDVSYNKCLLAYLADGKNRAIVIKDAKTGQIVARRIMRLLWNPRTNQPVLFQERLYNNLNVPVEVLQAIDQMFARRAKLLGVSLVRAAVNGKEANYPNALQSLGSPSPFEYVDAGGLGVTNGIFTIDANKIFRVQS